MTLSVVSELGREALEAGLLLRLKVTRPFNLWLLRLVVADQLDPNKVRILGEMKAWAYGGVKGLQLDTMRVSSNAPEGVGHLIWAATMAWALEETPCKQARLLAICDEEHQHLRLVRYFLRRGFKKVREVGSSPRDLPLRMVWGGAGVLMSAECKEVLHKSLRLWKASDSDALSI
ncbi:hypothetical protein [Prochlorococcus sp. MIT 1307]|uniref:hypothetical protein n=1 Tax=Prochlorococcus sp. MIT 1307 TaxID=3096219 RepID=UPI002A747A92|nr:hypothetical protein [Prochlorococcus sp. MIT 1307]